MLLSLYTWDGNAINDGSNYVATIPPGQTMPTASPEYVNRGQQWPQLAGKTLNGSTFTFQIILKGTLHSQLETLKQWFRSNDFTYRNLIAKDTADSDRQYYLEGFPIQPPTFTNTSKGGTAVSITLAIKAPYWKEYSQQSDTWSVTATGQTKTITTRGNTYTPPTLEITPTSPKAGATAYRRYVIVYNQMDVPFSNYPLNLVGDLDTAALVTGGKMQADGDDLLVNVDGVPVDRWLYGINTTTTRVWINLSLRPKIELTLESGIANSGTPNLVIKRTAANIAALKALPEAGALLIDNEVVLYDGVKVGHRKITLTTRNAMSTTISAHSAGATVRWIEHTILVYYGDPAATAPVVNDNVKPMFDLSANSSNTQWEYTSFTDIATRERTARWQELNFVASRATINYCYFGNHVDTDDDPATEAGMRIASFKQGGTWRNSQGELAWQLYCPPGIATIASASGEKYRKNSSWPGASLQKSKNGKNWTDVATITTPGSANTWTAWSVGSTSLGTGTFDFFRFYFEGTVNAGDSAYSAVEMSAITLTLTSANVPSVTLKSEISNYFADLTITNTTTGESLTLQCVMDVNETVYLNCENLRVYNTDGQQLHGALDLSTTRQEWLNLAPGANILQYDDTGTAAVTVVIRWRGWNLI